MTFFECSEKPSQTKIIYSPIGDFSGNLADFFTGKMLKSISNPSFGNEKEQILNFSGIHTTENRKVEKNPRFVFPNSDLCKFDLFIELLIHSGNVS